MLSSSTIKALSCWLDMLRLLGKHGRRFHLGYLIRAAPDRIALPIGRIACLTD
jgi:hypothetical protein